MSNRFQLGLTFIILAIASSLAFQNCSQRSFTADQTVQQSLSGPTTPQSCSGNRPEESQSFLCSTVDDTLTGEGTEVREVTCSDDNQWITGEWVQKETSNCKCADPRATQDGLGRCVCPLGTSMNKGICETVNCDPDTKPAEIEEKSCPYGQQKAYQRRTVTCDPEGNWQFSDWGAWNYSACRCPAQGQIKNSATGECNCPTGQAVIGKACVVLECNPGETKTETRPRNCPVEGEASDSRTATCNAKGKWTYSPWISDFSTCRCKVTGQIMDSSTGKCDCPGVEVVVGNRCQLPQCLGAKPSETDSKICPTGVGNLTRTRTVSCSGAPKYIWETTTWSTFSDKDCGCSVIGQTYNPATKTCSCPAGQAVAYNRCRIDTCTDAKEPLRDKKACPVKGYAYKTRTATCSGNPDYKWEYSNFGAWDYSTCECDDPRDYMDPATGKCSSDPAIACSKLASSVITESPNLTFKGNKKCQWEKDGNLPNRDGYAQARQDYHQSVSIPADAVLCSIHFGFKQQSFAYDDEFLFSMNDLVIATSFDKFLSRLNKISGTKIYKYDWTKVRGISLAGSRDTYCYGSDSICSWPATETQGQLKMKLSPQSIQDISRLKPAADPFKFSMTVFGDNNNDTDCMQDRGKAPLDMNLIIKYVRPSQQR